MRCVVIYSGGTDSTCVAALKAQTYDEIHLLSYVEDMGDSSIDLHNIEKLKKVFPKVHFIHRVFSVRQIVRHLSYERYVKNLFKFRWLMLATCGFTSLSWHIRTIRYCLDNKILDVFDGLTRELMHFPGHMTEVIEVFSRLYKGFSLTYENPVRTWTTPRDQQFLEKLVVDQHGFCFPQEEKREREKTTGHYLHKLGILPHSNVKGSAMDRRTQLPCYPFILYNIMAFWIYLNFRPYEYFCAQVKELFEHKSQCAKDLLLEYEVRGEKSKLYGLLT